MDKRSFIRSFLFATITLLLAMQWSVGLAVADKPTLDCQHDMTIIEEFRLPICTPQRIIIESLGVDQAIDPSDNDEVINPSSWWDVIWWTGGGCPSSTPYNSENLTTYLFGHASNNLNHKVVFDDIDLMESGEVIIIVTDIGNFSYEVEEVFILKKADFLEDERVTMNTEGRLLLVSCWTKEKYNRRAAKHNVVTVANLKSFNP